MEYIVVTEEIRSNGTSSDLEYLLKFTKKINDKISEGYDPLGGLIYYPIKGGYSRLAQSMVKKSIDEFRGGTLPEIIIEKLKQS